MGGRGNWGSVKAQILFHNFSSHSSLCFMVAIVLDCSLRFCFGLVLFNSFSLGDARVLVLLIICVFFCYHWAGHTILNIPSLIGLAAIHFHVLIIFRHAVWISGINIVVGEKRERTSLFVCVSCILHILVGGRTVERKAIYHTQSI